MLNRITRTLKNAPRTLAVTGVLALALAVGGCTQTTAPAGSTAGSSQGSAAVTAPAGSTQNTPAASDEQAISVEVVVDSSAADGSVSYTGTVELEDGATVLDALKATGLETDVQDSQYGAFVNAIDGLTTGAFGDASGWGYDINGEMVMDSADVATVSDGDVVTWTYLV